MEILIKNLFVILLGYFLGSIPFAFLIGKLKNVDIREKAIDGARGASLTWKNVGKIYGLLVATLDISKGFLAVLIANTISQNTLVAIIAGLAAIIGHNWSIYMNFTGGKGAATTAGNLFYLLPKEFFISFLAISFPVFLFRKKNYFVMPYIKKQFKTSNFLSGVFFITIFGVAMACDKEKISSFSPIIYAIPMIIKDIEIKKREKYENNIKKRH